MILGQIQKWTAFLKREKFTKMFRLKVQKLIIEYGIKKEFLIELINSNRVTFGKKLKGELEFNKLERTIITSKYGDWM